MPKIIVEQTDYLLKNISAKAFETVMELSSKIPEKGPSDSLLFEKRKGFKSFIDIVLIFPRFCTAILYAALVWVYTHLGDVFAGLFSIVIFGGWTALFYEVAKHFQWSIVLGFFLWIFSFIPLMFVMLFIIMRWSASKTSNNIENHYPNIEMAAKEAIDILRQNNLIIYYPTEANFEGSNEYSLEGVFMNTINAGGYKIDEIKVYITMQIEKESFDDCVQRLKK